MKKSGFFTGISYYMRGFGLIFHPNIRRFAFIPIAINAILFALAFWFGFSITSDWIQAFQQDLTTGNEGFWQWFWEIVAFLSWIIIVIFVAAFFIVTYFGFTIIANIIASPFNSLLAEKIEKHLGGEVISQDGSLRDMIKDAAKSIGAEFRKMGYFLKKMIPFFFLIPLGWIFPPISLVVGPAWFMLVAWMLMIEYGDYPMGNHAIQFEGQREILRDNRSLALGFGSAANVSMMIPGLNLISMPVSVAAATALWVDKLKATGNSIEAPTK